jgi:hypothetical protein
VEERDDEDETGGVMSIFPDIIPGISPDISPEFIPGISPDIIPDFIPEISPALSDLGPGPVGATG